MRRRVLLAILSVTATAVVLFGVPLAIVVPRFVDEQATVRLEREAVLAAGNVPADFASGNDPVELPASGHGIVLGLYDTTGALIAGAGPGRADATTTQALTHRIVDREVGEVRIVGVPIASDEQVIGVIRAEQPTAASDARTHRILTWLGLLALGVLAIGALIGHMMAGRLARPVERLRDAAVQLGEGDFALVVPRSRVPELDQAASAMTATAHRLDELLTRERSFSADASHQLRTPLAGLRAAIETELALPRADRNAVLHEALSDIDRLESTIGELLAIARTANVQHATMALDPVLNGVAGAWGERFTQAGRQLTIAPSRHAPEVRGTATMLRHALDVLVDNALQHGSGEVRIDLATTDEAVIITVADEGDGFTQLPTLISSATAGDVHGLGLPLARRLVEALPGRLSIRAAAPRPHVDIVLQRVAPNRPI